MTVKFSGVKAASVSVRSFDLVGDVLMERRSSPRYPLRLTMTVVSADESTLGASALTCNVSRNGVLFRCAHDLNVGQQLNYVINLYPDRGVQLRCKGRVVRCVTVVSDPADGVDHLFAATLDEYECVRNPPSIQIWSFEEQYV